MGSKGLATATALAQKGHSVTMLESKPALNEFGANIGILANGVRPLKAWGLQKEFEKVVTKNRFLDVRNGLTNKQVLARAAEASGAKLVFDAETVKVDVDQCNVILKDGRELVADVVIGADGMKSAVRQSIPELADIEPIALEETCFRCTVLKDKVRGNPKIEWLLNHGDEMMWTAPGRYVISWPMLDSRPYDVITCIERPSDVPAGRWGVVADPDEARAGTLETSARRCVKWTLAELPPLSTCKSRNGKVVLIGDAFHAMLPHTASGGTSSIEDAACIAECLDCAFHNGRDVSTATQAFEDMRKARVERMQTSGRKGMAFLNAKDDFIPIRDQAIAEATKLYDAELALPEDERRSQPKPEPDMSARFPLELYLQWLYTYDAIVVTKEHLAQLG